jgi:hypothetical protein
LEVLSTFNGRTFANLSEWFGQRLLDANDLLIALAVVGYQDPDVAGAPLYACFPAEGGAGALEHNLAVN